jgi:xylulokinase
MTYFLGIDYGTSRFKVYLFDSAGHPLESKNGEVGTKQPQPGWVEQDLETGWQLVSEAIGAILNQTRIPAEEIRAVGITGTSNISLLDESGRILRPAILYGDTRLPTEEEIQVIQREIGPKRMGESFGFDDLDDAKWTIILRLSPSSKLLWIRKYEPDIFHRAAICLTASWDFLNFRLTGNTTYWKTTFELEREIAEIFEIPLKWFGEPREIGEVIGQVDAKGASESGLTKGTPIVLGGTDSGCMFLGSGLTREGIALNAAGTTDVVAVTASQRPQSALGYPVKHIIPGLWMLSLSPVRGPTLRWFRDLLLPEGATYQDLDNLASHASPGSDGLLCLPYFSGEKGFVHDPSARGMLLGLNLHHGKTNLARAILEGIAFSTRQILDAYREQGHDSDEIRLCGGGAGSALWNQIKADIFGQDVYVLKVLDAGCLGAAIMAAVAVGDFNNLNQASDAMSQVERIFSPNAASSKIYHRAYQTFQKLYPLQQSVFRDRNVFHESV